MSNAKTTTKKKVGEPKDNFNKEKKMSENKVKNEEKKKEREAKREERKAKRAETWASMGEAIKDAYDNVSVDGAKKYSNATKNFKKFANVDTTPGECMKNNAREVGYGAIEVGRGATHTLLYGSITVDKVAEEAGTIVINTLSTVANVFRWMGGLVAEADEEKKNKVNKG